MAVDSVPPCGDFPEPPLSKIEGEYQLQPADADGLWRSRVFPGLWLDGEALLARDMPMVLRRLQEGLRSAEHEQFVEQLAARRRK